MIMDFTAMIIAGMDIMDPLMDQEIL
jgi:hypothetical protein